MRVLELTVVEGRAFADGAPLDINPGSDPAAALIAHAQHRAHTEGALLAHLRDGAGTDAWVHIAPDGRISPAEPPPTGPVSAQPAPAQPVPAQPVSSPPASAPPSNLSAWSTTPDRTGPRPGGGRASGSTRAPSRRTLLSGAGALGVLALGGGAWALTGLAGDDTKRSPSTPSGSTVRLPNGQNPPAGWSPNAAWQLTNLVDPKPQIAVRGDALAAVTQRPGTGSLAVTLVDAGDGRERWSKMLDVGELVVDGPYISTHKSAPGVFVATNTRLIGWNVGSGATLVDHKLLAPGASAGFSLLGPWVEAGGRRVEALTKDGVRPFDLPPEASCFGAVEGRLLAVDNKAQVWKLESGRAAGKPTKLEGPKGAQPGGVVSVTDRMLVLAWNSGNQIALRGYDLTSLKPRWTTPAQVQWNVFLGTSRVAPDQTWATVGNRRIDLSTGHTAVIAAKWNPITISDDYAWGEDGTYVLACDQAGKLLTGHPQRPIDETVTTVGGHGRNALVTSAAFGSPTLYSLPRA